MAAISGSGPSSGQSSNNSLSFGRSVTVTKKIENYDEKIEMEADHTDRKNTKKRENVKSSNNLKTDEKDMRKDNDTKKNKKENTVGKLPSGVACSSTI